MLNPPGDAVAAVALELVEHHEVEERDGEAGATDDEEEVVVCEVHRRPVEECNVAGDPSRGVQEEVQHEEYLHRGGCGMEGVLETRGELENAVVYPLKWKSRSIRARPTGEP